MNLSTNSSAPVICGTAAHTRIRPGWLVALLLVLFGIQAIHSMVKKSVTVDEITYIAAGYYNLRTGDFSYNNTNPVLFKMASALPLLLFDLDLPPVENSPDIGSDVADWQAARIFMYENRLDSETMLLLARLPIVCTAMLLAWLVWKWTSELYGSLAGLVALFLFCFSPNILAHARLATQDLGLTATTFAATYFTWQYFLRPTAVNMIASGLFIGLALATKTPAVLLAPVFAGYGIVCILRREGLGFNDRSFSAQHGVARPRQSYALTFFYRSAFVGIIALATVNAVYCFQGTLTEEVAGIPCPLPASYVEGVKYQAQLTNTVGGDYFAGQFYPEGLWYNLPATLLIKTPIPLLLLVSISLIANVKNWRRLHVEWLFAAFIACFLLVFSLSKVDGGLRYVLPVYPFLFVLAGRLFQPPFGRWRIWLLGTAATWYLFSSLAIHPHYLAYCNELIGGPNNGYKYFAGSNLDWGQDLKGLRDFMEQRGMEKIKLAYFGSADADYYGINYEYLPSVGLTPNEPGQLWWYEMGRDHTRPHLSPQQGPIAISATLLAAPSWMRPLFFEDYGWLRKLTPDAQVGHTILIYQLDANSLGASENPPLSNR